MLLLIAHMPSSLGLATDYLPLDDDEIYKYGIQVSHLSRS